MKKLILSCLAICSSALLFAAQPVTVEIPEPAECNLPKEAAVVPAAKLTPAKQVTPAEQKKAFEARRKLIKKLVKEYRKAPEAQKPAIKEKLAAAVSVSVDSGIAHVKGRIAAERANLDNWEAKIKESEANLAQVKAQRVDDLISGESERKYKEAQKEWKKQMKAAKEQMN